LVVVSCGLLVGFFSAILGAMRSSDAYRGALIRANASPAVADALGSPWHVTFFFTGNIVVNGGAGRADLEIPIQGPKSRGTLTVLAVRLTGQWHFERLILVMEGSGKRIDLSDPPLETTPSSKKP
jgi:hypothetical protein